MRLRKLFGGTQENAFKGADSFCEHLNSTNLYDHEKEVIENFDSLVGEIKDWVQNRGFKQAEVLMDLVVDLKEGQTRADGITPSSLHEMTQALWFISAYEDGLPIDDPEGVLSVIFAHDIGEDFGMTPDDMEQHLRENAVFDDQKIETFKQDFDAITKQWGEDGEKRFDNNYEYYTGVQKRTNASIAKMLDRAHNIMTLIGVKDVPKMHTYIASTLQLQDHFTDQYSTDHPTQKETYEALAHLIRKEIKVSRFYTVNSGVPLPDDDELVTGMPEKGFTHLPIGVHPLIVTAERVREMYPETHLASNPKRYSEIIDKNGSFSKGDNADLTQ